MINKPWRGVTKDIRPTRLNALLEVMNCCPCSYLEVGVAAGETLFSVEAGEAVGVDPQPSFEETKLPAHVRFFRATSDEFFRDHAEGPYFDLIYLDGLHEWKQTLRDFQSSLHHLKAGGIIVIDDVFPTDPWSASPDPQQVLKARAAGMVNHGRWYGDVYKVLMALAKMPSEFSYVTLGLDRESHGQTIVWKINDTDTEPVNWDVDFDALEKESYGDSFLPGEIPRFYNAKKETSSLYKRLARAAQKGKSL